MQGTDSQTQTSTKPQFQSHLLALFSVRSSLWWAQGLTFWTACWRKYLGYFLVKTDQGLNKQDNAHLHWDLWKYFSNPSQINMVWHDGPTQIPGRNFQDHDVDREDVSSSLHVASFGSWETGVSSELGKHSSQYDPRRWSEPLLLFMGSHRCLHC